MPRPAAASRNRPDGLQRRSGSAISCSRRASAPFSLVVNPARPARSARPPTPTKLPESDWALEHRPQAELEEALELIAELVGAVPDKGYGGARRRTLTRRLPTLLAWVTSRLYGKCALMSPRGSLMVYSPKGIITLEGLEPGHQRMIYLERCPRVTRRTLKDRVVLLTCTISACRPRLSGRLA